MKGNIFENKTIDLVLMSATRRLDLSKKREEPRTKHSQRQESASHLGLLWPVVEATVPSPWTISRTLCTNSPIKSSEKIYGRSTFHLRQHRFPVLVDRALSRCYVRHCSGSARFLRGHGICLRQRSPRTKVPACRSHLRGTNVAFKNSYRCVVSPYSERQLSPYRSRTWDIRLFFTLSLRSMTCCIRQAVFLRHDPFMIWICETSGMCTGTTRPWRSSRQ